MSEQTPDFELLPDGAYQLSKEDTYRIQRIIEQEDGYMRALDHIAAKLGELQKARDDWFDAIAAKIALPGTSLLWNPILNRLMVKPQAEEPAAESSPLGISDDAIPETTVSAIVEELRASKRVRQHAEAESSPEKSADVKS